MNCSRHPETQTVLILKEANTEASVKDIFHRHIIGTVTWYQWEKNHGGSAIGSTSRIRS